jgi:hypothetical protein
MKKYEAGILLVFLMLLMLALNWSCKSVNKSQSATSEESKVVKSDSSSVKTFTVIDTTKTDESTTVTEYEIEVDSMYTFTYDSTTGNTWIEHGKGLEETTGSWSTPLGKGPWPKSNPFFAKKVKIKAKITETKKAEQKGQILEKKEVQADTKSDSTHAKAESSKEVERTPSAKLWIWFWLILALIALAWWKRGWIITKVFPIIGLARKVIK